MSDLPPIIEDRSGIWVLGKDERFGPFDTTECARAIARQYQSYAIEGKAGHVTKLAWTKLYAFPPLPSDHLCTDWRGWACTCQGACGCHYQDIKGDESREHERAHGGGYWFWSLDRTERFGPSETLEGHHKKMRMYLAYEVEKTPGHVDQGTWEKYLRDLVPQQVQMPEGDTADKTSHECNDWRAWVCRCGGSCFCHFVKAVEQDEAGNITIQIN
jgi:hypothetical protein